MFVFSSRFSWSAPVNNANSLRARSDLEIETAIAKIEAKKKLNGI